MEQKMDVADTLARRKPQLAAKRAMDVLISGAAAVLFPVKYQEENEDDA